LDSIVQGSKDSRVREKHSKRVEVKRAEVKRATAQKGFKGSGQVKESVIARPNEVRPWRTRFLSSMHIPIEILIYILRVVEQEYRTTYLQR